VSAERTAVLGGGCFWCLEAVFKRMDGVLSIASGYAGGAKKDPTYEEVCTGETGHAEVVRISFDPEKLTYRGLLDLFWKAHDPTTLNRQGGDGGTQYRSIILCQDEEQRREAEDSLKKTQEGTRGRIVTEIKPLEAFFPAEDYHKDYFDSHRSASYCRLVIAPKLHKMGLE
jgi:peptide-methionine (S)-S-oxide reductase